MHQQDSQESSITPLEHHGINVHTKAIRNQQIESNREGSE